MNNTFPTITIDLVLDRLTTKDVLHGVLHSILFHRLFGTVRPQTLEVLDVTMPGVADPEMEQLVNEKVDAFWKGIEGGVNKRGQIVVTFSEKRPKKSWFQVYMGEEDVPWEQWVINAELRQPKSERDRQTFNATLANTLTKTIHTMLTHTSSEKGRTAVPLITNAAGISPFPIKMTVKVGGVEVG
ncbi:autophagy-related protein [Crucibulum laeve]|uniref:Autophagy-related protein 101 n=1 Tax=Crucibulum laeve TaxID=68775 RepID=A0A5C3LSU2_9AGAR|nr:autophagy-related protein [Crucibulum laeve]